MRLRVFFLSFLVCYTAGREVYIAPHSHCDAGWTSTFEQYYQQRVKNILNSVIDELENNDQAVFNWAEVGYLSRWWEDGDVRRQQLMKKHVAQGRIVWAGGGWVQNDEAVTHYRSAVNQMTEGHLFLKEVFEQNFIPNFGWQIDPFGHSASTPIMFSLMGFKATVTDRVSTSLCLERIAKKEMEFFWVPPFPWNRTKETTIFTHELGLLLYGFPGFMFESIDGLPPDAPVTSKNLWEYHDLFSGQIDVRANAYSTQQLLVPWGNDFMFYNGSVEWMNMGKVMQTESDAHYATISSYFAKLASFNITWPTYTGDFFPYVFPLSVDGLDSVWSGFYTSRAALKGAIRAYDSKLETIDAWYSLAAMKNSTLFSWVEKARR